VEEIIIDGDTGKVQFVILDTGASATGAHSYKPVPWESVHVNSDKSMTMNSDKQKLQSAPTVTQDHFADETPAEVVAIYEFYAVEPPAGTGANGTGATGAGSSGTSGTSTDQQGQSQQKDQQQNQQQKNQ